MATASPWASPTAAAAERAHGAVGGADPRPASRRRCGRSIRDEIWVKLWGNLAFNPCRALTTATLDVITGDAELRAVLRGR